MRGQASCSAKDPNRAAHFTAGFYVNSISDLGLFQFSPTISEVYFGAGFDERGRLIWLSGVTTDITERKLAEERAKSCWPKRLIIARAMSLQSCRRSCDSPAQIALRNTTEQNVEEYSSFA